MHRRLNLVIITAALLIVPNVCSASTAHDLCKQGTELLLKKNYAKAIDVLTIAITLNPKLVEAYGQRGCAYGLLNQHKRAIEDADRALVIDPNYIYGYELRANAYHLLEQADLAKAAVLKKTASAEATIACC